MRATNICYVAFQYLFCLNLCIRRCHSFYPTASGGPSHRYQDSTCSSIYNGGHSYSSCNNKGSNRISSNTVLYSSKVDKIKLDSLDWSLQKGPDKNHPNLASLEKVLDNELHIPIKELQLKLSTQQQYTPSEELSEILSLAMENYHESGRHVVLDNEDDTDEREGDVTEEIYVTEQELKRLWLQTSDTAMGKSMDKFNTEEALLLIADSEEDIMIDEDDDNNNSNNEGQDISIENSKIDIEEKEIYVTSEELKRIWHERSKIKFGMPGVEYNDLDALLLLDPEDADDVSEEGEEVEYVDSRRTRLQSDDVMFWQDNFPQHPELANALKDAYTELEDRTFRRPAWKKERPILTPDIDTQSFMGDMMFSNTYMTQRIPANWNDQE